MAKYQVISLDLYNYAVLKHKVVEATNEKEALCVALKDQEDDQDFKVWIDKHLKKGGVDGFWTLDNEESVDIVQLMD